MGVEVTTTTENCLSISATNTCKKRIGKNTTTSTNVSCNSGTNGTIDLTVTGGTTPYTYLWNGGATTQDRTGLSAGNYSVTVTDANGYTTTASVTITQPAVLAASATSTNVNCNGGSIELS